MASISSVSGGREIRRTVLKRQYKVKDDYELCEYMIPEELYKEIQAYNNKTGKTRKKENLDAAFARTGSTNMVLIISADELSSA
jgi:hypothetical protein